jgi:hypothetical protein
MLCSTTDLTHRAAQVTDVLGLLVILGGLVLYRFSESLFAKWRQLRGRDSLAFLGATAHWGSAQASTWMLTRRCYNSL